jgi:energy-converting hydrogenase Eha subunit E
MTALVKAMGAEGNYIDLLMTHRENILSLLKAKYYFHVAILVVPFLLAIPAVIAGKFSILMVIAYALLTSGVLYLVMFQLGVYNKQTLPLNQKITGKGNVENGLQLVIELLAMFIPVILVSVLLLLFNETVAYLILSAIGLITTLAHPWWLRNIYRRMMARRYENLEGFHASR